LVFFPTAGQRLQLLPVTAARSGGRPGNAPPASALRRNAAD
jgi:hypothetical protein